MQFNPFIKERTKINYDKVVLMERERERESDNFTLFHSFQIFQKLNFLLKLDFIVYIYIC